MRKVRIHRDGGDGEGLWAAFSDEGLKDYADDNSHGKVIPCILVNSAINFYPNNSWGLYIPVTTNGSTRPECNLNQVDFKTPIFCQERIDGEAKAEAKTKAKTKKAPKTKAKKCKCDHC